jgi:hypothetical protein
MEEYGSLQQAEGCRPDPAVNTNLKSLPDGE